MSILWNCPHLNATRPHWWLVNIVSGNDFMSSGSNPLPDQMLTQIYIELNQLDTLRHLAISSPSFDKTFLPGKISTTSEISVPRDGRNTNFSNSSSHVIKGQQWVVYVCQCKTRISHLLTLAVMLNNYRCQYIVDSNFYTIGVLITFVVQFLKYGTM